jgi:hypothetical protein
MGDCVMGDCDLTLLLKTTATGSICVNVQCNWKSEAEIIVLIRSQELASRNFP